MALTPQQLYDEYSNDPCLGSSSLPSPYSQLTSREVYNTDLGTAGKGTPHNILRIVNFLKHVKYPCLQDAPGYDDIVGTGKNKFSPTFKILQQIDGEAYVESQPTVKSGTSYSVRNCCDLSRACFLTFNGTISNWKHRMATEYLEYFAHRSLPDCLMMCGPDLVHEAIASCYRAPGMKVAAGEPYEISCPSDSSGDYLTQALEEAGMTCFPMAAGSRGVAGARHSCYVPTPNLNDTPPKCFSFQDCPTNPVTGEVIDPNHPCCKSGSIYWGNECLNNGRISITDRDDFSLWVASDDGYFDGTILNGRIGEEFKHIGILQRILYPGYANFMSQCSGESPPIALPDIFLNHFREINGWNYTNNTTSTPGSISRARTISVVLKATINDKASVSTDAQFIVDRIKDLLFNGYGAMLMSNIGFNNNRDSTGIAYPDRVMYHTYNIIGYDDTKTEYDECVYVMHLPFGAWIDGGHPSWGPLPDGSFLVTESHLKCLVSYYPTSDFYNCRQEVCINTPINDCSDPLVLREYEGCGAPYEGRCTPYYCTKQQQACGLVFAISMDEGFPAQNLNLNQFLPIGRIKDLLKPQKLYYQ